MKAISISKSSLRSSSFLNTVTYLSRSSRLATSIKAGQMVRLDRTAKFRLGTDWMGKPIAWLDSEVDRLQHYLTCSNSEQYCSEDLLYLSRNLAITAENLEEAAYLEAEAKAIFDEDLYVSKWEEIYDIM